MHNSIENTATCIGVFRKVVLLKISRNLQLTTLLKVKTQPKVSNVESDVYNPVLSQWIACNKLQLRAFRIFQIQEKSWDNLSSGVSFLQNQTWQILCGIFALNNFMEKFQEGLQVFLKRTLPQMFSWKVPKNFWTCVQKFKHSF